MRIVLDTNVLVSGLLNPNGYPGRMVDLIVSHRITLLYDDRIIAEYSDVLARPQLDIPQDLATAILSFIRLSGEFIAAQPLKADLLPDPDDLPFAEVGISGKADSLVTGNIKHFRTLEKMIVVLSPAEIIDKVT